MIGRRVLAGVGVIAAERAWSVGPESLRQEHLFRGAELVAIVYLQQRRVTRSLLLSHN